MKKENTEYIHKERMTQTHTTTDITKYWMT